MREFSTACEQSQEKELCKHGKELLVGYICKECHKDELDDAYWS